MLREVLTEKKSDSSDEKRTFAESAWKDLKNISIEALHKVNQVSGGLIGRPIYDIAVMPGDDNSVFVVMPDASTVIVTFKPLSENATREYIDAAVAKMDKKKEEENAK